MKTNRFGKKWKAIGVLLVFVLLPAFSGCGRKAPPEPPESGSLPALEYAMFRDDCRPVSAGAGAPALKIGTPHSSVMRKP